MKTVCPQCGADIHLQPRSIRLVCPFCNTPLVFDKKLSLESYRLEPTCEQGPAVSIVEQSLKEKGRKEKIVNKKMLYLPFYRFLFENEGMFSEKVVSALKSTPIYLFSIPSASIVSLTPEEENHLPQPQMDIFSVLEELKGQGVKSVEEMLLLYIPFWKVTLSNSRTIWVEATQGKILSEIESTTKDKGKFTKIIFSGLLILLFIEGIFIPSWILRFFLQGITTGGLFFFLKRM
jgi:uncharacterized membrane protein YobD (UPF0266 family)